MEGAHRETIRHPALLACAICGALAKVVGAEHFGSDIRLSNSQKKGPRRL